MSDIKRNIKKWALDDPLFKSHMTFISGPRQCGKTTLAQNFLKQNVGPNFERYYFNWDNERTRKQIKKDPYFFETLENPNEKQHLVFDEIHKMRMWKQYLKGVYDTYKDKFHVTVTGSGRLDLFQRGGDSLAGRYDLFHMFPLTPAELEGVFPCESLTLQTIVNATPLPQKTIDEWTTLGGFPEPFFSSSHRAAVRWWEQYKLRVIQEDIRSLTKIDSLDLMNHLMLLLPQKVASPLSLNSLREDLECAHDTVARHVRIANQVFFVFSVSPYHRKIARAVKKEKKIYFYHHPAVTDEGNQFENQVALLLKKWCHSATEQGLGAYELCYLRDQDRREVDFLLVNHNKPVLLIEAKKTDTNFTSSSLFYAKKLSLPILHLVATPNIFTQRAEGIVCSLSRLAAVTG